MGIRKHYQEEDSFSFILAPLLDVVLFLLIFFMVSYSVQIGFQNISLPVSQTSIKNQQIEKTAIIEMNTQGIFYLKGKSYTAETIMVSLEEIAQKEIPIIFKADKNLSYQQIMLAMDIFKKAKINKIYLATY